MPDRYADKHKELVASGMSYEEAQAAKLPEGEKPKADRAKTGKKG